MQLEAAKYLWDIQQAITKIAAFTAERSIDGYQSDEMLRSAVERQFTIAGEALSKVTKIDRALASRISDRGSIVAFRNILVHNYDELGNDRVWEIVEDWLPILAREVASLLEEAQSLLDDEP